MGTAGTLELREEACFAANSSRVAWVLARSAGSSAAVTALWATKLATSATVNSMRSLLRSMLAPAAVPTQL